MKRIFLVALLSLFLASCGYSPAGNLEDGKSSVSSIKNMPKCTSTRDGESVHVMDEGVTYVCEDGKWIEQDKEGEGDNQKEEILPKCSSKREGKSVHVEGVTYVCEDGEWIEQDEDGEEEDQIEEDLPNCTSRREGERINVEDIVYVCEDGKWVKDVKYREGSIACKVTTQTAESFIMETRMNSLTIKTTATFENGYMVTLMEYNMEMPEDTCEHYKLDKTTEVVCAEDGKSIEITDKTKLDASSFEALTALIANGCKEKNGKPIPDEKEDDEEDYPGTCDASEEGTYNEDGDYVCYNGKWVEFSSLYYYRRTCFKSDMWSGCDHIYKIDTGFGESDPELNKAGYWFDADDRWEGGESRVSWPVEKGNGWDANALDPIIDECRGICGAAILASGRLTCYPYVMVGFNVAGENGEIADVSAWGGLCVVYSSDVAMELILGQVGAGDSRLAESSPVATLPKGVDVIKNFSWSDFKMPTWSEIHLSGEDAAKSLVSILFRIQQPSGSQYHFNIKAVGREGTCSARK